MLSLFLGPCLSPLEADSFMGVQVQEEVMEPAFLGSKLKKRVSFQEDVDNAAPDSSGTSGEATRATESSPESTVGSGRDGSTRSHGRLSLTDRVVRRHNRNFLRARLAVVAFLESNGFSEIDVNCKKSSSFGLVRTYPLHEAAKQDNGYISYWLLHLGADPLKKDSSGRTPIDLINPLTSDPQVVRAFQGLQAHRDSRRIWPPPGLDETTLLQRYDPLDGRRARRTV